MEEKTFNQKLIDAMKEMGNPKKEKQAYKYKYETLEQLLEIVKPALIAEGLMLMQGVKWNENIGSFVLETGVMDASESRVLDTRPFHSCEDAQAEGSWETYMRRYGIRTAFALTGEDDDGEATKYGNKQNTVSNRGKTVSNNAPEVLMQKLNSKLKEFSALHGKTFDEAKEALMQTTVMKGVKSYDDLTEQQANAAISQLVHWIDKSAPMADEDYVF